jgi:hypothetical protein
MCNCTPIILVLRQTISGRAGVVTVEPKIVGEDVPLARLNGPGHFMALVFRDD